MKSKPIFWALLRFEVKDRLWRISSLIYFVLFFSFSLLLGLAFGGAFKGASVSFGLSNKVSLNSPIALQMLISFIGYIGLLVVAPIFGQSINKDFENRFSQILFATPIKKFEYFFSHYIGSVIASVSILSSIACGLWFASILPVIDASLVGPQHFLFYVVPYLTNVIPNIIIFGAVFIAAVSIFKKMAPVYVVSIAIFTGWMISQGILSDLDNLTLASLIEPFGIAAAQKVIRYWSVSDQNTRMIPLVGVFLYNRLIWGAFGLVVFLFSFLKFDPFKLPKEKAKKGVLIEFKSSFVSLSDQLPKVKLERDAIGSFIGLAKSEFKQAFTNLYFLIILLCGVLYIFAISGDVNKMYGTETYPVTYSILEIIGSNFSLFIVILTTFYAGELIWKERDQNFFGLVDSKPVSNLSLYLSKLFALISIQVFLDIVIMICCILIQTVKGYTHFEFRLYFEYLFIVTFSRQILSCIFILFVQVLCSNKFAAHGIVIFYFIGLLWLPSLGLDHRLYLIGKIPVEKYSDLNHFGTSSESAVPTGIYWLFFHIMLGTLSVLFWRRGVIVGFKSRIEEAKRRFNSNFGMALSAASLGFVGMGAFIFYNTNILNSYLTKTEKEKNKVDYEKTYRADYNGKPHLTETAVSVQVDLFPETQSLKASGIDNFENRTGKPLEKVLINIDENVKNLQLTWSKPAQLIIDDKRLNVRIYQFNSPIQPKEKVDFNFSDELKPVGFNNDGFAKTVVENGSFVHHTDFMPMLNYRDNLELEADKTRHKYGLADRPRTKNVNDPTATDANEIYDADWINFDTTVSTSADQIAIAPGYLEKDWFENGRHYYHYKMDKPILSFYSYLSARYTVDRDEWNGVKIEIYHHPEHTYDVQKMIYAVKKSLEYYTKNFSPFQFRQVRIIEFPRYDTYAQSFPNTIPFSEGVGFIAKVNDKNPEDVDYPFYITSHEVAHQWWGHQVVDAQAQGVTMIVESLAQYSALMTQEKEFGPYKMKKFLKYELDRYLRGRASEIKKELPLDLVEGQEYIRYQKGSLVFYALKDYLGEDVVNGVLRNFIKEHAFKGAPYPRAVDLVAEFKKVTPADKQYLIHDLFETITLYDNRAESVTYKKEGNQYRVTLKVFSKKVQTDELGKETEVPVNDEIDIGVLDDKSNPIYLKKHLIHSGENTIELLVDKEPAKGGIDPINKLIDRDSDDNVMKAKAE